MINENIPKVDFSGLDIRLAGGNSNLDGRVERRVNGIWGTVCRDKFDMNDAQVVCKMLSSDLSAIQVISNTNYGPGTGPIFYNQLHCSGSETSIDECSSITGEQCEHYQDVAIVCSEGQEYHGICSNGSYNYNFIYLCLDNGTWIPTDNSCGHITNVRLVDGVGLYDGIVEVLVGDTWGTICGSSYWYLSHNNNQGSNVAPMIDQMMCSQPNYSFDDCKYDTVTTCYNKYYSACNVYPLNITGIRLSDGGDPQMGRVELQVEGQWGKICEDAFDVNDAAVFCRMMGLNYSATMRHIYFGKGSGPALMNNVDCAGSEDHINNCSYNSPNLYCDWDEDISLLCTECGVIDIKKGNIESYNSSTNVLTVDCHSGITIEYICLNNGTWMTNEECPFLQDIRLVDGVGIYDGRVEVLYNGTWGTICYNNYRTQNTRVICRMLGASRYTESAHAGGIGPIHIENLYCGGNEINLTACVYDDRDECSHSNDLGVTCCLSNIPLNVTGVRLTNGTSKYDGRVEIQENYDYWGTFISNSVPTMLRMRTSERRRRSNILDKRNHCNGPTLNISSVRLVDGDGIYEGRVEIEVNGTYGTICDSLFDLDDAEVICKTYNRSFGAAYYFTGARFGKGSGPIHIDRLFCGKLDTSLFQCPYHSIGFCDHSRDVSLVCNGRPLNIQDVRLFGGQSEMEGRVEIKSMDIWGTICKDGFDMKEADVICNMIGFP
ncbi:DMBT1-like protein [Mya arenaria]|uniref:DMBT1-like protein n=1 Tax=Mya arenaria TaxID=6604 RepID=A0ABY7FJU0_MYAAR|nr:DMBT1-like protein [Mya arenaria]